MAKIRIITTQNNKSGNFNESRDDLIINTKVVLTNGDNSGLTDIEWEMIGWAQDSPNDEEPDSTYTNPVKNAYIGASWDDYNKRIYLSPYMQAPEIKWQYINSYDSGEIIAYKNNITAKEKAYINGAYDSLNKRIYFCPFEQANENIWHFIACDGYSSKKDSYGSGTVVPFLNNSSVEFKGYSDCVYDDVKKRIYFIPFFQAKKEKWHYIDCNAKDNDGYSSVNIVSYDNEFVNEMVDGYAYSGGIYDEENNRIYFSPYLQSVKENWHYVECSSGKVISYKHNTNITDGYAYSGGVYDPLNKRIYLVPYSQGLKEEWHYIECDPDNDDYNIGDIVAYKNNTSAFDKAYVGGAYCELHNRIFFAPFEQTKANDWHGIDCLNGKVFSYKHNKRKELTDNRAYAGAIYDSVNERVYFVPYQQSEKAFWHYIDCVSGDLVSYINGENFTFTPRVYGTYIIQLTLNGNIRGKVGAAIKSRKLGIRYPSTNEGNQFFGSWQDQITSATLLIEGYGIHNDSYQEIFNIEEKNSPSESDIILIEDSEDGYSKKKVQFTNFPAGTFGTDENAIHDNVAEEIYNITEKTNVSDNDLVLIEDSEDGYSKKSVKVSSLPGGDNLQYVQEKIESTGETYYQLTYVPSNSLLSDSNKIIKCFKDGLSMNYDVSLSNVNYYNYDSLYNSILFNTSIGSKYRFCYWTDGNIFPPSYKCWIEYQKLLYSGIETSTYLGRSACISGNYSAMGIQTTTDFVHFNSDVVIYEKSLGIWSQYQKINQPHLAYNFGSESIVMFNDTLVIGAHSAVIGGVATGAVYVYVNIAGTWTFQQILSPIDGSSNDEFGRRVDIYEDTIVVGSSSHNLPVGNNGAAYVYTRTGSVWSLQQKLLPSDSQSNKYFGSSVSVYKNTIAVGSNGDQNGGLYFGSGAAYIFKRTGSSWVQESKLLISDIANNDYLGSSIKLFNEENVFVGAPQKKSGVLLKGFVYLFSKDPTWIQKQKISPSTSSDGMLFGYSIAVSGKEILISAPSQRISPYTGTGAVYAFNFSNYICTQLQRLRQSVPATHDKFGWSISAYGDDAIFGTPQISGAGIGCGYIFIKDWC